MSGTIRVRLSGERGIIVYGAGGHGKVVADILLANGLRPLGFVDDALSSGTRVMDIEVLGGVEWLRRNRGQLVTVALGLGNNGIRQQRAMECLNLGFRLVTAIHPMASVANSARLGDGVVVVAGAVVNAAATVGDGAIVNTGAVVGHDVCLGAFAHVSANAVLAGGAVVGERSHVGIGANVLPGVRVGRDSVVGAGAVVTKMLEDNVVAYGVPATVRRVDGGPGDPTSAT